LARVIAYLWAKRDSQRGVVAVVRDISICSGVDEWLKDAKETEKALDPFSGVEEIREFSNTRELGLFERIENSYENFNDMFEQEVEETAVEISENAVEAAREPPPPIRPPEFSHSEEVRLFVVLRDEERTRSALHSSMGQKMSRSQLDARKTRDSFWGVVEERFNDAELDSRLDLTGRVDDICPNQRPLAFRKAAQLKTEYIGVRAEFTLRVTRWKASGQNDPDRFPNFLDRTRAGELYATSKSLFILFTCCRLGEADADETFYNLSSKMIRNAAAGYDEGTADADAVLLIFPPYSRAACWMRLVSFLGEGREGDLNGILWTKGCACV